MANREKTIVFIRNINGDIYGKMGEDGEFIPPKKAVHYLCASVLDRELLMLYSNFTAEIFKEQEYKDLEKTCELCGAALVKD